MLEFSKVLGVVNLIKKIVAFILSNIVLFGAGIENDISSTLPDNKEEVRCLYDTVAVKLKKSTSYSKAADYRIRVYDNKNNQEVIGKSSYSDGFLIYKTEKGFSCNKKFRVEVVKKSKKQVNKKRKVDYSWTFSTEKEIDIEYEELLENFYNTNIFGITKTVFKKPTTIKVEVGGKTIEVDKPKKEFKRKIKPVDARKKQIILAKQDKIAKELSKLVSLIKAKKWEEANEEAYRLFEKNSDSPKLNFYMGMIAFNLKDYDSAVAAYERVLIVEPNHLIAKLELAKIYFILKMYDQAEEQFELIRQEHPNLPPQITKKIEYFLTAVEDTRKRNSVNVIGLLTLQSDNGESTSDTFHREIVILQDTYDFGKLGGWKFQGSLMGLNQNWSSNSDGNIGMYTAAAGLNGRENIGDFTTKYEISSITLGSGVALDGKKMAVSFKRNYNKEISYNIGYTVDESTLDITALLPSADETITNATTITIGGKKVFPKRNSNILSGKLDMKSDDTGSKSNTLSFNYLYNYSKLTTVTPKVSYKSSSASTGDTTETSIGVDGGYKLTKKFIATGAYSMVKSDTDTKNSIGVTLMYIWDL